MTNIVKHHPVCGTFIMSTAIAKAMCADRWFSHQVSNLDLAKTILDNGRNTKQETLRLKNFIQIKEMKITCVRSLSRISFLPMVIGMTALYLDNKLSKNDN